MKFKSPQENYESSKKAVGYICREDAKQEDYDKMGFRSGLEVHQQLAVDRKLFCHCPTGIYQKPNEYDAEFLRHMRPTLSELGTYDGAALMEYKTKKQITYRISTQTACTYEMDEAAPFAINPQALQYALRIALLYKFNIANETHIIRKQILDGSFPTGFRRTAILGIDGEIKLENKKIKLTQINIEEDACREISDIKHSRIFSTDRLGTPMIEIVTSPDMKSPQETMDVCNHIRFMNRSTEEVKTGIGSGRQDINVSCTGGSRIEIKGVAHTKWIPNLTHNECFRQWALLAIKNILNQRTNKEKWEINSVKLNPCDFNFNYAPLCEAIERKEKIHAVNLPHFKGILSHFTQPNKTFYDEYTHRLKVIACLERPNIITSEDIKNKIDTQILEKIKNQLQAQENDAQLIFWAPDTDVEIALETIKERSLMAFDGVPSETRKACPDGTTIFERIQPGVDRMYPDTDTSPIPLDNKLIEKLSRNLPDEIYLRYKELKKQKVPTDCYHYILTHNYIPIIRNISNELNYDFKTISIFFGHKIKHLHGQYKNIPFDIQRIYDLFAFLKNKKLDIGIAYCMLKQMFIHPKMDFCSILNTLNFKEIKKQEIIDRISFIQKKFKPTRSETSDKDKINSIMGQLRNMGVGNINLSELSEHITI